MVDINDCSKAFINNRPHKLSREMFNDCHTTFTILNGWMRRPIQNSLLAELLLHSQANADNAPYSKLAGHSHPNMALLNIKITWFKL